MPVEGPPRITLTITTGTSAAMPRPMDSIISDRPGPEVTVIDGTPPNEPPSTMLMEDNSSSAITSRPPSRCNCGDIHSTRSVAGVIG